MLLLSSTEVLDCVFHIVARLPNTPLGSYTWHNIQLFKSHFGSNPIIVSCIWLEIQAENIISKQDKKEVGFEKLLHTIHFL